MSGASAEEILLKFGGRLRIRVCGICIRNNEVLLVKHINLGAHGFLWSPPGGGMEFGENASQALIREFYEETGLEISIERFLFVNEFLDVPLHGIELFFLVNITRGVLIKGTDPEMGLNSQMIQEVAFRDFDSIKSENADSHAHFFKGVESVNDIKKLSGYCLNGAFFN